MGQGHLPGMKSPPLAFQVSGKGGGVPPQTGTSRAIALELVGGCQVVLGFLDGLDDGQEIVLESPGLGLLDEFLIGQVAHGQFERGLIGMRFHACRGQYDE